MSSPLTLDQLNAIGQQSGYQGPAITSVGLPTSLNSTNTAPTTPLIASQTPTPPNYQGAISSIGDITKPVDNPVGDTIKSSQSNLETLIGSLGNKSADQQAAEQVSGATDYTKQLTDLGSQITSLKNEALGIPMQAQNDAIGVRGVQGAQDQSTRNLRDNSIKALTLNSLAATLQGNLTVAQAAADKSVALKYDPIEAKIKQAQQQITDNMPFFNAAEQKQAAVTQANLAERARLLGQQKEDSTSIISWANAAVKNGATNLQAQAIANAPDLQTALKAYLPYAVNPQETQKAVNDLALQRAEIDLRDAQTSKAKADANKAYQDAKVAQAGDVDIPSLISGITNPNLTQSSLGGLTVNGLTQKAQVYMTNGGNIQGLGLSNTGNVGVQRQLIANYAAYLATQSGLSVPQITAAYKANSKAATQVTERIAKIDTTSSTLSGQFPRLAQLATNVGSLGITESDLTAGKANVTRKFGSVDAGNYVELIQTIRGDYAAMQAAIGGGRGGEFFNKGAQEAIPIGLTADQYLGIAQTIKQSAAIAQQASGDEITKLIGAGSGSTGGGQATQTKAGVPFDYAGAKAAGYSDADIQAYINSN